MAVRIRLKRMGTKKRPFYRFVVADSRYPRDGRFIEEIGYYNPLSKELKLDKEKAQEWIGKGAQPSDTVKALLKKEGVTMKERNIKRPAKVAASSAEEPEITAEILVEASGEELEAVKAAEADPLTDKIPVVTE